MTDNPAYRGYEIGAWSYGNPTVLSWGEGTTLRVGKFCSFAEGVTIFLGGEHRTDWVTTYPFNPLFPAASQFKGHPMSRGDVVIGHDVWLGRGVTIRSGVRIGSGAVLGAGSMVTKNVDPYSIVAGNPAKAVRLRFTQEQIEELLRIAWWDWPLDRIQAAWPLLLSPDISGFIASARENSTPPG